MRRCEIDELDPTRTYWVPAVVSPQRDWAGAPGCRRGARFLVDSRTLLASRDEFAAFDTQLDCLCWIMRHRAQLNRTLPGVSVNPAPLDRWLLGID